MKECSICKKIKPLDDFYPRYGKRKGHGSYCKACHVEKQGEYRKRMIRQAIEYLGGSCARCGYNKCDAALEFHHTDPTQKEFRISGTTKKSFASIQPELEKCELLCANCHREHHYM